MVYIFAKIFIGCQLKNKNVKIHVHRHVIQSFAHYISGSESDQDAACEISSPKKAVNSSPDILVSSLLFIGIFTIS